MTIGEASAVMQLLHFLDGTSSSADARARAMDAAQLLAQRAGKPLQLTTSIDVVELDDAFDVLEAERADATDEPPARTCRVCGEPGCFEPVRLIDHHWRHVSDVAVAGGRL